MGRRLLPICWCLGLLLVADAVAQVERVLPRRNRAVLEGTEFLVGFMENEVPYSTAPVELRVFIASEFRANVTIEYPTGQVDRLTVQPEQVQVATIAATWMSTRSETVECKSLRVRSDVPVVVYVLNSRVMSTDSYTAIPVRHFGTEYMVMSRGVDRYRINLVRPNPEFDTASRQSEFLVMATEDNTTLWITPTAATERGLQPNVPSSITMMSGETYLVKGAKGGSGMHDLSGTRISADKPIGVLSGHVRSSVPRRDQFNKDHLAEMLVPMDKWGYDHITTPLATSSVGDVVRIMAGADGTVITAETAAGTTSYNIPNAGGWIEFNSVNYPVRWTSTQPVMVAQFMLSQQMSQTAIMDPAMVIVPPVERYVDRAVFRTPELLPQQNADPYDYVYYFSVIADVEALPTLTANGTLLTSLDPGFATRTVPGTRKVWSSFQLNPATVVMKCDTGTFSGVMYGVGPADSYANIYGWSLDPRPKIELTPPSYALSVVCGNVTGTIADVSPTSPFLQEVSVQNARTFNYDHAISPPIDSMGTVEVRAWVRDLQRDARLVIHAWDSLGNGREWEYTYDAPSVTLNAATIDVTAAPACTTLVLRNRDTTAVRVGNVRLSGDARYRLARTVADVVIPAGDSVLVEVCLDGPYAPPAPPATVTFELPCGLTKSTTVRPSTGRSIATVDLDLGPVRIGDTACGHAFIVNDGIDPITVTSMWLDAIGVFRVDTAALGLPRTLGPGDTLRVRVCLTPDAQGPIERTDSVLTAQGIDATVSYRGRGVRPRVDDVVIDWRRRRVGTTHDTTLTLSNTGDVGCLVRVLTPPTSNAFDLTAALQPFSPFVPGVAVDRTVRYTPQQRGRDQIVVQAVVDWRGHDTVRLTLRGEATMPEFVTTDVHMGDVRIDASKDSAAAIGIAGGNEALTIDTLWLEGADAAAFVVDASILQTRGLTVDDVLQGVITFAPRRVGGHVAEVVIMHDAAPGFERRTSRVRLTGNGLGLDTTAWEVNAEIWPNIPACLAHAFPVTVRNTGNTAIRVDGVDVWQDGRPLAATSGPALPVTIGVGREVQWIYYVVLRVGDAGVLDVTVRRSDGVVAELRRNVRVDPHPVVVSVTSDVTAKPGDVINIEGNLSVRGPGLVYAPVVRHIVARDRWFVEQNVIEATLVGRTSPLLFDVERTDSAVRLVSREALIAPFEISWTTRGTLLWKDPAPFDLRTVVEGSICTEPGETKTDVRADICGATLRMVRFGAIPMAGVTVAPMPASEEMNVTFDATDDMVVDVELVDVSGTVVERMEKIVLKKGSTVCKFRCSTVASGTYRLRVGQETGTICVPVVIVN
jgi:hypothetical protein